MKLTDLYLLPNGSCRPIRRRRRRIRKLVNGAKFMSAFNKFGVHKAGHEYCPLWSPTAAPTPFKPSIAKFMGMEPTQ